MLQEPTKISLEDKKLESFHSGLLESGYFSESEIGTIKDFKSSIGNDPSKLIQFRDNLLATGRVSIDMFGGDDAIFISSFAKKKDDSDTSWKDQDIESPDLSQIQDRDEPGDFELKLFDYNSVTDSDGQVIDYNAAAQYDQLKHYREIGRSATKISESVAKKANEISNVIAESKKEFDFSQAATGKGIQRGEASPITGIGLPTISFKSDMRDHFDNLEDSLNEKYNPDGLKSIQRQIRAQITEGYSDAFQSNFYDYLESNELDLYDALVRNPKVFDNWKKTYDGEAFGEIIDRVQMNLESDRHTVILEEVDKGVEEKLALLKEKGYSDKDAALYIARESDAEKRKQFEATINKEEWERYEKQREINRLMKDGYIKNRNQIITLQSQIESRGDELYDERGRRTIMPKTEEMAEYDSMLNAKIDEYWENIPNMKENVELLHDENWKIYKKLEGEYSSAKSIRDELLKRSAEAQDPMTYRDRIKELNDKMDFLSPMVRNAKINLDASGRMFYANENLALQDEKRVLLKEFFDTLASTNELVFSNPTKDRSTPAQRMEAYQEMMLNLGYDLSDEEKEEIKGLEFVRQGAYMTDLVLKISALGKLGRIENVGFANVVDDLISVSRMAMSKEAASLIGNQSKTFKGTQFAYRNMDKLTKTMIGATYEGAQFAAIEDDPMHGFAVGSMFYGSNQILNSIPPIFLKNKLMTNMLNSMVRAPLSMTATMEGVATTQAVISGMMHNKDVSTILTDMWGAESDWEKRVLTELALAPIFGVREIARGMRQGTFYTTHDRMTRLQEKLLKEGKFTEAAEIADMRSMISQENWSRYEAERYYKKYDYLLKNGHSKSELRKNGEIDLAKIDELFNKKVTEPELYEKVLGKGAIETAEAKKRVLKKVGMDVEGLTPGSIESAYYKYKHDPALAKKYAKKIAKEEAIEEISMRKKKLKEEEDRLSEARHKTTETIKGDQKLVDKIQEKIERTELENQYVLSNRSVAKDKSKKRTGKLINKYREDYSTEWNKKSESSMSTLSSYADDIISVLNEIKAPAAEIKKLQVLKNKINESVSNKKPLKPSTFERYAKEIINYTDLFRSKAIKNNIQKKLDQHTAIGAKVSHKANLMARAFDYLLNREAYLNDLKSKGETSAAYKKAERKLKEFEQLERQVDQTLKGEEPLIPEVGNMQVYEAVKSAMDLAKSRGDVYYRRQELRRKAQEQKLSEKELMEYDLLSAYDHLTMTENLLATASRSLDRILTEGRSVYKSEKIKQDIQNRLSVFDFAKDVDYKVADVSNKVALEDAIKQASAITRRMRGARLWVESFSTMMEYMMSQKPGRQPLTGSGHAFTEGLMIARNREAESISYWAKEATRIMTDIFGSPNKARDMMKKWGENNAKSNFEKFKKDFYILKGEGAARELKRMTIQEAMTMYSYMRQPGEAKALEAAGYKIIKNGKAEGESIVELRNQIEQYGGKEAIKWVEAVTDQIMPRIWNQINERYKIDTGVDLPFLEKYFPILRQKGATTETKVKGDPDATGTPLDNIISVHTSYTKSRSGGTGYNLLPFNKVFFDYIGKTMHYVSYQGIIKDMNTVFGNNTVKNIMAKKFGSTSVSITNRFMKDLAGGEIGGDRIVFLDNARSNFVRARLGFNIGLFPKQMMSVNAYQSEMSVGESLQFMKYAAVPDIKIMRELTKLRELQLRYEVNEFNRELAERGTQWSEMMQRGGQDRIRISKGKGLEWFRPENLRDNMLIMTKYGDLGAILVGGQAFYKTRLETYKKKGYSEKEAMQRSINDFLKATEKTQQSGAIHNLSHLQRVNGFGKMMTLFQNTPLQYLRIEMAALTNMMEAAKPIAKGKFSQADGARFLEGFKTFSIYHFILPTLFRYAANGFYIGDDEKSLFDDPEMFQTAVLGSLSYAPALGTMVMELFRKQNEGFSYGVGSGNTLEDMIADTFNSISSLVDIASNHDDALGAFSNIGADDVETILTGILQWGGIPTHSLYHLGKGIYDYTTDRTDDELALLGYSRSIYQGNNVSVDFNAINRHLPHNGGTVNTMLEEFAENKNPVWVSKNKSRLVKEYKIYEKYGAHNSHVNFLYKGLKDSHNKAEYLFKLFRAEVQDQKSFRKNYTFRQLKNDLDGDLEQSYGQFMNMISEYAFYGVITPDVIKRFHIMLQHEDVYEELYK